MQTDSPSLRAVQGRTGFRKRGGLAGKSRQDHLALFPSPTSDLHRVIGVTSRKAPWEGGQGGRVCSSFPKALLYLSAFQLCMVMGTVGEVKPPHSCPKL